MKLWLCIGLMALSASSPAAQASRDASRSFESAYKDRLVVLKQTLHSIASPCSLGGPRYVMTRGTLILTPDNGAFHSAFFGTKSIRDRDPAKLWEKGAAETQISSPGGPKLLKHEPGTKMRMTVQVHDNAVRVLLYDELADRDHDPSTSIEIQWPQKFSRTFTERTQIEEMLAAYLVIP